MSYGTYEFKNHFSESNNLQVIVCGFLLFTVTALDYITGFEISFFIFYSFPIALASWYGSRYFGIMTAMTCIIGWAWADYFSGHDYSHPLIPYWNGMTRLFFFIFIAIAVRQMKEKFDMEVRNSTIDSMTKLLNSRGFFSQAHSLHNLLKRENQCFTLAYVDLDNFKKVNDTMGHSEGDNVLISVARTMKTSLRKSDIICRMGGDEFVLLLPNTNESQAKIALSKLKSDLDQTSSENDWPVGYSIGAGVYSAKDFELERAIKQSDALMYDIKKSGKGRVTIVDY